MNLRGVAVALVVFVMGALVAAVNNACGSDSASEEYRFARKGEACQTTNDCSPGLACMPSAAGSDISICVLGAFAISQSAKECAVVDCSIAEDCCPTPPTNCDSLAASCEAGIPSACLQFQNSCICNANRFACENTKCVTKCTDNNDCLSAGSRFCSGGKCVACSVDTDCASFGTGYKCASGQCKPACKGDGDCPGFERCRAELCVEGGCETNRECVASTRNVEATCGTDGKCIVPCATDLECGNPKGYTFFSCVAGQCLFLGCETDKDCRLLFFGTGSSTSSSSTSSASSSGSLGPKQHVVCREKTTPGSITKPAN
jgi:hypothetical protein